MSSSRVLCCLPSAKKQKQDFHFNFRSLCNKTIIRFGFVIYRIIKVEARVIGRSQRLGEFFLILSDFDKQDKM